MNRRKRSVLYILWFCPGGVFLLCLPFLAPLALWGLFFIAAFSAFYGLALFLRPIMGLPVQVVSKPVLLPAVVADDGLPFIPRGLDEARLMDPEDFEVLSAAVLIGMGQGYRFYQHCGQSGDQGVDVKLYNVVNQVVAVQSKRHSENNMVGSPLLREFAGSIVLHRAAYGYFVTTSTFTPDAQRVISENTRIRVVDGRQLESLLKWRAREIRLALRDVREVLSLG